MPTIQVAGAVPFFSVHSYMQAYVPIVAWCWMVLDLHNTKRSIRFFTKSNAPHQLCSIIMSNGLYLRFSIRRQLQAIASVACAFCLPSNHKSSGQLHPCFRILEISNSISYRNCRVQNPMNSKLTPESFCTASYSNYMRRVLLYEHYTLFFSILSICPLTWIPK